MKLIKQILMNIHLGLLMIIQKKVLYFIIDGSIYCITPIDPLFLIKPIIDKFDKYQNIEQLIDIDSDFKLYECKYVDLELICDYKEIDSEKFYKFSSIKWIEFLVMKYNGLINSILNIILQY